MSQNKNNGWAAIGVSLAVFLVITLILQFALKPLPSDHPIFPYVTLQDDDLPYFNKKNFNDQVFAFYALDAAIARDLGQHPENPSPQPLGEVTSEAYMQALQKPVAFTPQAVKQELARHETLDPIIYDVQTNSRGFRGRELSENRGTRKLRIVAVGDSITFGFGLPNEKTWVYLLNEELKKRAPASTNVEVINAGVISFDSNIGKRLVEKKILGLEPDWLIVGYGFNDYAFNARFFVPGEDFSKPGYWEKKAAQKAHFKSKIIRFLNRLRVIQGTRFLLQRAVAVLKSKQGPPPFPVLKTQLQAVQGHHNIEPPDFEKNIEAIIQLCKQRKIKVLLLNTNVTSPNYVSVLRKLSNEHNLPFEDFRSMFGQTLHMDEDLTSGKLPVTFRVEVPKKLQHEGAEYYVVGSFFSSVEFGATQLNDAGTNGDEKAGDGIYSATIPINWGTNLEFRFGEYRKESPVTPKKDVSWEEEFHHWKVYRHFYAGGEAERDLKGENFIRTPVYHYNDLSDQSYKDYPFASLMTEVCHPNSLGNRVVAQSLTESFVKYLGWEGQPFTPQTLESVK